MSKEPTAILQIIVPLNHYDAMRQRMRVLEAALGIALGNLDKCRPLIASIERDMADAKAILGEVA